MIEYGMRSSDEYGRAGKLLDEVFGECDIEKLSIAIDPGLDVNMADEWGIPF